MKPFRSTVAKETVASIAASAVASIVATAVASIVDKKYTDRENFLSFINKNFPNAEGNYGKGFIFSKHFLKVAKDKRSAKIAF